MRDERALAQEIQSKLQSPECPALSEDELNVLKLRWGLDDGATKTLAEVAAKLDKTRENIRQLEHGALLKLRLVSER